MTEQTRQPGKAAMLWELIRGQRMRYAAAIAAMIAATAAMYVVPLIGGAVIDFVVKGKELRVPGWVRQAVTDMGGRSMLARNLWIAAVGIVAFTGLAGLLGYLRDRWTALASETITRRLRDRLYDRLQNLPCSYHDKAETGDLVQRCTSDVETVRSFLGTQTIEIARAVIMLAAVLPFMVALSPRLTLLAMAMMPVVVLFAVIFFSKVRRAFKVSDEAEGAMTAVLQENLTGIRVVRAFARQEYECGKFARSNALFRDTTFRLIRLMSWYWSSSDYLCHIQNGLLLVFGSYWIIGGSVDVGTLFAFMAYENMLLWPMRQMGRTLTELGKALVSIGRLQDILNRQVEDGASPVPDAGGTGRTAAGDVRLGGAISIRDLGFAFNGHAALDGISLDVKAGQTAAILGPSGAGKSALVHLLLRLYDYQRGSIRIDGRELREIDRRVARSQIGVVLQEPFLYSKTLRENIKFGSPHAGDDEVSRASTAACIHDSILSFDHGYDTIVGERGVTLSGGQRQRVALARAMLKDPPILILDDALSAVDTRTESMILNALRMRHGKRTTIIISHRLSALMRADRIFVLEHGRITQEGAHEELLRADGLYRRLWLIQSSLEEDLSEELANG
ncbi:MAG: ABC transporter ATP-binding protein [Phycisphaerae bacterium]